MIEKIKSKCTDDGELFIRSSRLTCAEAFFLASKAARWAQEGGVS